MKKVYDFYQDPGHGWLKVEMKELVALGIHLAISGYSYMKGDNVYLEEDCDLSKFFDAKLKQHNVQIKYRDHHSNKSSKIRNYDGYSVYRLIPKPTTFEEKRKSALLWWRSIDNYNKLQSFKACGIPLDLDMIVSSLAIHRVFCDTFNINSF
jgi:hypothetical protein